MNYGANEIHQIVELARARQEQILSEAASYRQLHDGRPAQPSRWRKWRMSAGDLLINAGIWLKTGALAPSSTSSLTSSLQESPQ